jgi:hypothetical protein
MKRCNYFKILGSFIYIDLYILLFCSYNLLAILFLSGTPALERLSVTFRILKLLLLFGCVFTKDGKCEKYLRNGNGRLWDISKNTFVVCWVLQLFTMANATLFETFQILTDITGYLFISVQLWYIKTGKIS